MTVRTKYLVGWILGAFSGALGTYLLAMLYSFLFISKDETVLYESVLTFMLCSSIVGLAIGHISVWRRSKK